MRTLLILAISAVPLAFLITLFGIVFGGTDSAVAADFDRQCEVAIPNPSSTAKVSVTQTTRISVPSPPPTVNPYAQLTFAADDTSISDRQRACSTAMQTAVYQLESPLSAPATGAEVECAGVTIAALANRGSGSVGTAFGGTEGRTTTDTATVTVDPAAVTAAVLYRASAAASTGFCPQPTAADITTLMSARSGGDTDRCPATIPGTALILPNNVAAQSLCGQLVEAGAESPGDLVFWDYRGTVPTRVGMTVDYGQRAGGTALVLGWDPTTGAMVRLAMPNSWDVRVKRVLGAVA
ncbi:hypothetical protein [Nocardia sp. NPDC056100]|uniref:hypothetical protein n=1 Tax=Nocardia sp. NPDC056100 TaxID=3345712 RepID=UPI0035DE6E79